MTGDLWNKRREENVKEREGRRESKKKKPEEMQRVQRRARQKRALLELCTPFERSLKGRTSLCPRQKAEETLPLLREGKPSIYWNDHPRLEQEEKSYSTAWQLFATPLFFIILRDEFSFIFFKRAIKNTCAHTLYKRYDES